MIGVITVKVSAAKPSFPISTVPVFVGSDCTLAVADVPSVFYGVRLTSVSVSITNADGATVTAVCVRSGATWCATIPGAHFSGPGRVRAGLTVSACGTHEDGTTIGGWTLGRGDVDIMPADAVPVPGMSWQDVHLRDKVPAAPVKGDLAKVGGSWMLFTGSSWEALGGGGAVSSVNGMIGAVVLDAAAVGARPASWTPSASDVGARPDSWTPSAQEVGAFPASGGEVGSAESAGVIRLAATYYAAPVLEFKQSFSDASALDIPNSAMYEQTGEGPKASIKKGGKEVATEEQLTPISAQSAYPMSTVSDGALKDRTVNHATAGGTFTFPERTGTNARDFVLVIDALSEAPTVTFPGSVTYVIEQDAADIWTAEAGKVNAWYFSEQTDGVFMVCHKAMGVVSQ